MKNVSVWLIEKLLSSEGRRHATIREYAAGQNIFRVGDPGDYLAVLLSGSVEIRKGESVILVVEHGGIFGEMGIIDGRSRSADANAKSHCRIAEVREGQFIALMETTPHFGLGIMRILTERLRNNIDS
ncbi:MAG: cyclic nucleotide-binding domain-containing protein [Rhodocyclaceae bacterium]|nr:MAG: cyclic nucleotide-binding domain-containing protein [Rhodocyclaceae bacterium]